MNATLRAVAERDDWVCWLCGADVDAEVVGTPWAASLDHVVPKARGGRNDAANLRLAHRRCNSRRGSRMPELHWPPGLATVEAAPLWQALLRAQRRSGTWETVAVLVSADDAAAAADWVTRRARLILGGSWETEVRALSRQIFGVAVRFASSAGSDS